jgi:hypothetical protein
LLCRSPLTGAEAGGGSASKGTITLSENHASPRRPHKPWNKGRLTGQKRPLKPKDVWTMRVRLQLEARRRDLALFNLAIGASGSRLTMRSRISEQVEL